MNYFNFSQALLISRMWNFLDVSYIRRIVSDGVVYESLLVENPKIGKEVFLSHMERKLETIRNAVQAGEVQLYAHVVSVEGISNECFVKLNQNVNGQYDESLISISLNEDGMIYRLTISPLLSNMITHEIYPDE